MPRRPPVKTRGSVKIAKSAGFCFGVRRAINLAEKTAGMKGKVYTLGPLIHNPQEVRRLAEKGIVSVDNPGRIRNATLILRTHGIPAALRAELEAGALDLVDAACPFVNRAHDIVRDLSGRDFQVVIVGDRTHPEVVALVSYAGSDCRVVERREDLRGVTFASRVGIVSQTTQTPENFRDVIRAVRRIRPDAKVYNTICRATVDRQMEARRLARKVDLMVVIGGKNSANTRRLFEICERSTKTRAIETADELKAVWFRNFSRVGLCAGASTPDWIIEDVRKKIEDILEQRAGRRKPTGGRARAKVH